MSVLKTFMNDGVVYLELRTTPRTAPDLSADQYVAVLISTIASFEASNPALHVRLILSIDRRHDFDAASHVLDLALQYKGSVVGIDLCGDTSVRPAGDISVFTALFWKAKQEGLGITLHFAETAKSSSKAEMETLLQWEPDRISHVIHEDEHTRKMIVERKLGLELCLSCNVKAGLIQGGYEEHHFGRWKGVEGPIITLGVSTTISALLGLKTLTGQD